MNPSVAHRFSRVRERLNSQEWSFIRSSTIVSVGIALARVLGLGFSLVVARVLSTDDYGVIQYNIALANILAIATMPFPQHVLAHFVSKYKHDEEQLNRILNNAWSLIAVLFALTLVIAIPILLLTGRFNVGALTIFFGVTVYYGYLGLVRGYENSTKLLYAYLGSNLVQIVVVLFIYYVLNSRSTLPALMVYGLSYLLPLILLQRFMPVKVGFSVRHFHLPTIRELLRFSRPIWLSHVAYIIYASTDVLLLERFWGTDALGIYALTRTLTMSFGFVHMGMNMVLMPRISAMSPNDYGRIFRNAVIVYLVLDLIVLVFFALLYTWFVGSFFGAEYVLPLGIAVLMAVGEIVFGLHNIASAVFVGSNRPGTESISRVMITIVGVIGGFLLIPAYGVAGAATMLMICAIVANLSYLVLARR
jgi:O-antigen/teichoic acid export membrane protein